MKKRQEVSIKKNLAYQSFYEILQIVLPLLTSPYISRVLGAEGLGIYSYTYSIAYYFQLFCMLGLKFYGNRTIARVRNDQDKLNRTYSEILILHIILSIISTGIYLLYSGLLAEYTAFSFLQTFMVLAALFDISWLYFGLEQFKVSVTRNTIVKISTVIAIFVFVHQRTDLWKYILLMALGQFGGNVLLLAMSGQYVRFVRPQIKSIWKHMKPMLVLFVPVISTSLFKYMDKIMLGAFGEKVELGYYENAEKILNIPLSVILAFGSVMLPKMSNLIAKKAQKATEKYIAMSLKYMLCIAFAMAFGMAGLSRIFAPVFWGMEFTPSGQLIALLSISLPFSTVANIVRNQDLIPNGKDREYSIAIIVGAVANLIINYSLIPSLQSVGVTIGTIISEILVCFVQMFMVEKDINYKKYILNGCVFVIPGFIMYLAVLRVGDLKGRSISTLLVQILTGIVVYGTLTLLYFIATKDEEYLRIKNGIMSRIHKK